jgi:nitroreductase
LLFAEFILRGGGCIFVGAGLLRRRSLLKLLRGRRSIQVFKRARMPDDVARLIVEAGVRAPSYLHLQEYSIVIVADENLRGEIAKLCEGRDELIMNAAAIFLICADLNRPARMLSLLGHPNVLRSNKHPVESVFAVFDAGLVTAFMIMAAEIIGYGSTILYHPMLYPSEFAKLFQLPPGVTPLILLCVGERGESPPLRPRLPLDLVFFRNSYREAGEEDLKRYIRELGDAMKREDYVRKYIGLNMDYLEYLKSATTFNDELKKTYDAIEKFLKENLMRF